MREYFVKELKKYVPVDVYGSCGLNYIKYVPVDVYGSCGLNYIKYVPEARFYNMSSP
jgi:hypothetical protein